MTEQRSCVIIWDTEQLAAPVLFIAWGDRDITDEHEPRTLIKVERDLTHVWV